MNQPELHEPALDIGVTDVMLALLTFMYGLIALGYGLSPFATLPVFLALHAAVLIIPATFVIARVRRNGELTVPVFLLISTFAAGPIGALGCAIMAIGLRRRHPSPARLQGWYHYIAGVVARSRIIRIHDELISGRLPTDPAADVPHFRPILHDASLEAQQRVLGVIGRRYHPDFRPALRKALRHKNTFIRAQAAAVASRLDFDEKTRLWSSGKDAMDGARARDG